MAGAHRALWHLPQRGTSSRAQPLHQLRASQLRVYECMRRAWAALAVRTHRTCVGFITASLSVPAHDYAESHGGDTLSSSRCGAPQTCAVRSNACLGPATLRRRSRGPRRSASPVSAATQRARRRRHSANLSKGRTSRNPSQRESNPLATGAKGLENILATPLLTPHHKLAIGVSTPQTSYRRLQSFPAKLLFPQITFPQNYFFPTTSPP